MSGGIVTREEFEREYAERRGISVEKMHAWGTWAIPCPCTREGCPGWEMSTREDRVLYYLAKDVPQPVVELAEVLGVAPGSGPTVREVIEERIDAKVRLTFDSGQICYRLAADRDADRG